MIRFTCIGLLLFINIFIEGCKCSSEHLAFIPYTPSTRIFRAAANTGPFHGTPVFGLQLTTRLPPVLISSEASLSLLTSTADILSSGLRFSGSVFFQGKRAVLAEENLKKYQESKSPAEKDGRNRRSRLAEKNGWSRRLPRTGWMGSSPSNTLLRLPPSFLQIPSSIRPPVSALTGSSPSFPFPSWSSGGLIISSNIGAAPAANFRYPWPCRSHKTVRLI